MVHPQTLQNAKCVATLLVNGGGFCSACLTSFIMFLVIPQYQKDIIECEKIVDLKMNGNLVPPISLSKQIL